MSRRDAGAVSGADAGLAAGDAVDQAAVLDEAIERLRAGETIDACLEAYPEYAADLRPALEMAALTLAHAPVSAPLARARVRARVMAAAEAKLARQPWWSWPAAGLALRPIGFAAAAASALFVLGGGGAVVASASALPGEPLYPVKLAVEDVRLKVAEAAADTAIRAVLHDEIASRRVAEAEQLARLNLPVPLGLIEAAARHAAEAEHAAGNTAEPRRAQVSAQLAESHEQRVETLTRLQTADHVPPPARTAIARALEQGPPRSLPAAAQRGIEQSARRDNGPAPSVRDSTPPPATPGVPDERPSGSGLPPVVPPGAPGAPAPPVPPVRPQVPPGLSSDLSTREVPAGGERGAVSPPAAGGARSTGQAPGSAGQGRPAQPPGLGDQRGSGSQELPAAPGATAGPGGIRGPGSTGGPGGAGPPGVSGPPNVPNAPSAPGLPIAPGAPPRAGRPGG